MTDNRTTELLKDYAFALRRLEYAVDKPGSNMTLGEYEAEEKRVTDEYAQAITATLGNDGVERSNDGVAELQAENAKLRELVWDVYCLAYPRAVEWEVSDAVYDKYSPCEKCHELHGGKSPCASTSKDMTEECCEPIQAAVVADRMRALGLEVD